MTSHRPHGVSYHRPLECMFDSLFGQTSRKHQSSALVDLCEGNPWSMGCPPMSQRCGRHIHFMTSSCHAFIQGSWSHLQTYRWSECGFCLKKFVYIYNLCVCVCVCGCACACVCVSLWFLYVSIFICHFRPRMALVVENISRGRQGTINLD